MLLLRLIVPFIWEIMLGKQTWMNAIKTSKLRLALFCLLIGSLFLNGFLSKRTAHLATQVLECRKGYNPDLKSKETEQTITDPPKPNKLKNVQVHRHVIDVLEQLDNDSKGK